MKRAHFFTTFAFLFAVLLPSAVGCGEIDLPQPDDGGQQGNVDNGGGSDNHGGTGDNSGSGSSGSNDGGSGTGNGGNGAGNGENGTGNGGSGTGNGGNGTGDSGSGTGDSESGTGDSDTPAPGSIAAGKHAVITADGHILIDGRLYLSVKEYRDIPADGSTAKAKASAYVEDNLSGWRIPTSADVELLLSLYRSESYYYGTGELPALNSVLRSVGIEPLYTFEFYLCEEGRSYFTLDLNAEKSVDAVQTKKKYRLRLVRNK